MSSMIHHYMVDHLDDAGNVRFANSVEITSLTKAKSIAAETSKTVDTGAYVVAFIPDGPHHFRAVGHISFFDGKQSETDGTVI